MGVRSGASAVLSFSFLAITFWAMIDFSRQASTVSSTLDGRRMLAAARRQRSAGSGHAGGGGGSGTGLEWWKNVNQDPATCGIEDALSARLISAETRESATQCRRDCRLAQGCTGWFWCGDRAGCTDWQTGKQVELHGCVLLAADARPQPEPLLASVTAPNGFFSFQAGYHKGDLYMRPPHVVVATAVEFCNPDGPDPAHQHWQHGDWLNWISIANKQDYARLHGFDFMMTAVRSKESWLAEARTKVDLILELLAETAGRDRTDWLLWAEQNAMVLNPAYSLPFAEYERAGHQIIMYGDPAMTKAGHVNGFDPGVVLMRNSEAVVSFWRLVNETLHDEDGMREGMKALSDLNNQDNYMNYRNAMGILFKAHPQRWIGGLIHFEQEFCISCFYENADLQSPTMFITHFIDVSHCNDFSLSKDDPRWPLYNDKLMEVYRLSRCKHTVALRHGKSRKLAEQAQITQKQEAGGCDDGTDAASGAFPEGACELYSLPPGAPLAASGRGPRFTSFSSGFLRRGSRPPLRRLRRPAQLEDGQAGGGDIPLPGDEPPLPNMAVAMAIPDDPCAAPSADHINALSLGNKQDWAAAHGFEVHLAAGLVDANVTAGNWNKEAMIQRVLAQTAASNAEWVMWVDVDTVIPYMDVLPRFDEYGGKDLVVWGDPKKLDKGNMNGGINCGVLLIRNTEWSRRFFADVSQYAYMDQATLDVRVRPVLEQEVSPLLSGFYDTPFIVWLLKTRPEYRSKVFFEDQIGINRHWLQMQWNQEPDTLVTHYAGCTFCSPPMGKLAEPVVRACNAEFYKAYAFARCTLARLYVDGPPCSYDSVDLSWIDIRLGE